jgi:hypothetical protein
MDNRAYVLQEFLVSQSDRSFALSNQKPLPTFFEMFLKKKGKLSTGDCIADYSTLSTISTFASNPSDLQVHKVDHKLEDCQGL